MNIVEKSLQIAEESHKGEFRRGGESYISHPIAVAEGVIKLLSVYRPGWLFAYYRKQYLFQSVALLHDSLESQPTWTIANLRNKLITATDISETEIDEILVAINKLTKRKNESYFDYILRVKTNPIARMVKIADINHNLSDSPKKEKIDLYKFASYFLLD